MGDVYEKEKARLDEYVNAIEPLPRQCGAVFAVDGKVAGRGKPGIFMAQPTRTGKFRVLRLRSTARGFMRVPSHARSALVP
jgi:hypothetical protein